MVEYVSHGPTAAYDSARGARLLSCESGILLVPCRRLDRTAATAIHPIDTAMSIIKNRSSIGISSAVAKTDPTRIMETWGIRGSVDGSVEEMISNCNTSQ